MKLLLRVNAETASNEKVYAVGSIEKLGNWDISNALCLTRNAVDKNEWNAELDVASNDVIEYSYFVAAPLCDEKTFVVRRWESGKRYTFNSSVANADNIHKLRSGNVGVVSNAFGINCNAVEIIIDGTQLNWWNNELKSKQLSYKLTAFNSEANGDCISKMEFAILNDTQCSFQSQDKLQVFNQNEIIVFRCFVCNTNDMVVRVTFFEDESENSVASCAFVVKESQSHIKVPLLDEMSGTIGTVNLSYLVVKPFSGFKFELHKDCSLFKSRMINGIHVGHKGAGNNRRHDTVENVIENTIASLNYAADHGADMVEFDVVLTKDNIPVLYHDFHVDVSLTTKVSKEGELFSLKVKDLTFNQLHTLKLRPVVLNGITKFEISETDNPDNQPFVSLEKVLKVVKPIAFNLEIKYPTFEDNHLNMNEYVDAILNTLAQYGGDRDVVISCFDPNVCTMLRLKQNKYLVLYLTHGNPSRYLGLKTVDRRMWTVEIASYYAQCMNFVGVNCNVRCLMENMSLVDFVSSRNLLLFCFGDDINHSEVISKLQKAGVHGIIYDRLARPLFKISTLTFNFLFTSQN
ncbi:glycerophosphocholine phosphodiesterase GPCPD1-like protein [Leptotrombidium deliense]|uniref:Glycerophosphocholine phosphodiesterase GPCPD1-like protein n=1 Tax=Leptotrombidium deliense TaxID=299467 RepID=A0A443SIH2_9ACAR|nr:glycerophosphocholine phosphodiesterase GPCPD1-like protein [Leptotrombidium deliense]